MGTCTSPKLMAPFHRERVDVGALPASGSFLAATLAAGFALVAIASPLGLSRVCRARVCTLLLDLAVGKMDLHRARLVGHEVLHGGDKFVLGRLGDGRAVGAFKR